MADYASQEEIEQERMREFGRFAAPYVVLAVATQLAASVTTRVGLPSEGQLDDCIKRALYLVQKVIP